MSCFIFFKLFFLSTFFFSLSVVQNFWKCFPFPQKVLFLFHFFPINAMSSAYANIFNCSLPIFIPLGTIFILCITFCNTKLNNIGDKGHPISSLFYFQKFINLVGILNSFIRSLCLRIESYTFLKSINKYCTL